MVWIAGTPRLQKNILLVEYHGQVRLKNPSKTMAPRERAMSKVKEHTLS